MTSVTERLNRCRTDRWGEGGLYDETGRTVMADQPVLVIGLGGTGIDVVLSAKYISDRNLAHPSGRCAPDRLSFLAVDSDPLDLDRKQVGGIRIDDSEKCSISEPGLAGYMRHPETIPNSWQRDWLSPGISADQIFYGAGGIRQLGRFMTILKTEEIIRRIRDWVESIRTAGWENGSPFDRQRGCVRVYIVTGAAGGTGSGAFLDIAYLTRYVISRICGLEARLYGVVLMPDVILPVVRDQAQAEQLCANGYALLKELDFWMNGRRRAAFRQRYTSNAAVDTTEKPFDQCFLMSSGDVPDPAGYAACVRSVGEILIRFISVSADPGPNGGSGPDFEAGFTNLEAMLDFTQRRYPANCVFASMGMGGLRLRTDHLVNCLAHHLMERVSALSDRTPSVDETERAFCDLRLDAKKGMRSLFDRTDSPAPFRRPIRTADDLKCELLDHNRTEILTGSMLERDLEVWVDAGRRAFNQNRGAVRDEIMAMLEMMYRRYFADPKYGPFYAYRLLRGDGRDMPNLCAGLTKEHYAVKDFLAVSYEQIELRMQLCQKKKAEAVRLKLMPVINKRSCDEYIGAAFSLFDYLRTVELAKVLDGLYGEIAAEITRFTNEVAGRFRDLLAALPEIFGTSLENMARADADGILSGRYADSFADTIGQADQAFRDLDAAGQTDVLVQRFLGYLLEHRGIWIGDEGDTAADLSGFISGEFSPLLLESFEDSLKRVRNLSSDAMLNAYLCRSLLPDLEKRAKVMFPADDSRFSLDDAPHFTVIACPAHSGIIADAARGYAAANGIPAHVVRLARGRSLLWLEARIGLPLYAHASMICLQRAYDAAGANDHHYGRHLKMGTDENWAELLPSPLPDALREEMDGYDA